MIKRWYDKDKKLARLLESLKPMKKKARDELCTGIIDLIKEHQGSLIDDFAMDFPLELYQRRWYDKDPYLWLVFNGLSQADRELLKKVTAYLEVHITIK